MSVSIAIMAAGFGTRMKSSLPKVLHPVSGFPMLYHIIKEAQKISDDINIIIYHQAELIQFEMAKYFNNINYIIQDHKNFPGTGGAIMGIKPKYEKILILNGDMPLLEAHDMSSFLNESSKVIMSNFITDNPTGYGRVIIDRNKNVVKVVEEKDATGDEKKVKSVNAGVYLFDTDFLNENLLYLSNNNSQNEYYITDLIGIANKQNISVKTIEVDEKTFMGVNSKHHLAIAEDLMQKRIKQRFMEAGVTMRLPDTIYIESNVIIEGESTLENGVSLLNGSRIINSHIKTNSVVEDSILINSSVGPMARIRPNSLLEDTHIGNFVEIKKSTLRGVKAGHLSYLGDSEIDEGTNIGCGTITCNYDGKGKYQTKIGKNVFIGSDTQLIAPLTIEDDVIIASGTTVSKDVKKGSLAINRAPLKMIEGFYYKFFGKHDA